MAKTKIDVEKLCHQAGGWLRTNGPEADVVISSRVRLARNLAGQKFPNRATPAEKSDIRERLETIIRQFRKSKPDFRFQLADSDELLRQFLKERHLISREHADGTGDGRAVFFSRNEVISIMLNEEDHLRIQAVRAGLQLRRALYVVNLIDDLIADRVPMAFHDRFGYLTACPTNVGTGLRAGVMVHLPALFIQRHVEKIMQAAQKMGMVLRGFYGEGSAPHGYLFQISNQVTLGKTEDQLVSDLERLVPKVVEYERNMRDVLMIEQRQKIEDRVWRAWGQLTNARMIGSEEAMGLLSEVRLGISLGIVTGISLAAINELFVLIQPAHLQTQNPNGRDMTELARDERRADFIRERLHSDTAKN